MREGCAYCMQLVRLAQGCFFVRAQHQLASMQTSVRAGGQQGMPVWLIHDVVQGPTVEGHPVRECRVELVCAAQPPWTGEV